MDSVTVDTVGGQLVFAFGTVNSGNPTKSVVAVSNNYVHDSAANCGHRYCYTTLQRSRSYYLFIRFK